ncbi:MAG TPA: hypothetical protein VOA87_21415 [Thermoanaerobaculia bacterium]|nr:hypothetical protein [Thermoanaerobaculia bacterium]
MAINSFVTGDLFRQGTRQIVALAIDSQAWYQSRLCIFDHDGKLLSSYWHPGHLHKVVIGAPTPSAAPRIIVAGVNNDLPSFLTTKGLVGAVFMLDPHNVRGEAPPFLGRSEHGSQLWYGVLLPENQQVTSLELTDRDRDGAKQISVWTSTGHAFYLDFAGHVLTASATDAARGSSQFDLLGAQE